MWFLIVFVVAEFKEKEESEEPCDMKLMVSICVERYRRGWKMVAGVVGSSLVGNPNPNANPRRIGISVSPQADCQLLIVRQLRTSAGISEPPI